MKEKFIENGIEYILHGDYYLPNIKMPKNESSKEIKLGKYAKLRLNYLNNHKRALYTYLLTSNILTQHLYDTESECKKQFENLMNQLAEKENITEELKADNQMEWVGKINNIKNSIEEILLKTYIYV